MILNEHKKHPKLARPAYGNFGRNELALVGTHCDKIKAIADDLIKALSPEFNCAYADASHAQAGEDLQLPGRLEAGAAAEYTDQIQYHQFSFNQLSTPFQFRQFFNEADLVLVNGNHHAAKSQVVIIDPAKEASLKKRLSQLTDVQLFLHTGSETQVFDFLKEAIPNWSDIPNCSITETEKIAAILKAKLLESRPRLNGLVLAGGRSERMGTDKGLINWHGKEHRYFMADMLQEFCDEVFLSCRLKQASGIPDNYKTLPDTFANLGPYGAILSAFREQPDAAWLVVACDLPLLDRNALEYLIRNRKPAAIATTFQSPEDGMPEPLVTIWEPKSYPVLLSFLGQGISCPRKVLLNSKVNVLELENQATLRNVNTPDDFEQVKRLLIQKPAKL